jgi:hypothetical protein
MKIICDVANGPIATSAKRTPRPNPSGLFVGGRSIAPYKPIAFGPASFLRTCHGLVTSLRAGRSDRIRKQEARRHEYLN